MALVPHQRLLVALDTPEAQRALAWVRQLEGHVGGYKIGLELFSVAGPELVRAIVARGGSVFLDLKLHDIPNTVAGAAAAATRLGVRWITLHASGGSAMLRAGVDAARRAAAECEHEPPAVLAVTVLTSHDEATLRTVGLAGPCGDAVCRLAALARDAGVDGLVCSPLELEAVRGIFPEATLVVPGIRPATGSVSGDDQARTATPGRAVALGADYLVIGRPITRADDPTVAAASIAAELS